MKILVVLMIVMLPFERLPIVEQFYRDADLVTPLLIIAVLVEVFKTIMKGSLKWVSTPIDAAILGLILIQTLLVMLSPWHGYTAIRYMQYSKVFFFYYFLVKYIESKKEIEKIIKIYMIISIFISVYGVFSFFMYTLGYNEVWGLADLYRIAIFLQDPNILAVYMITPLLLSTSLILQNKKRMVRFLLSIIVATLLLAFLFTFSRSGTLGLFFSLIVFFAINSRYAVQYFLKLAPYLSLIILVVLLLSNASQYSISHFVIRFLNTDGSQDGTNAFHYYISRMGFEIFKENPLGVGRGNAFRYLGLTSTEIQTFFLINFGMNYRGEIGIEYQGWWPLHSSWLEFVVGEGVIGLLCFCLMIFQTFRYAAKALRKSKDEKYRLILSSFTAGFAGMLLSALFYTFDPLYFFWFIIAMIIIISRYIITKASEGATN